MSQAAMMGMLSPWNPGAKPQSEGNPLATSSSSGTGSSSSAAADAGTAITANDFLTLLVTEMQNQDPTADVDPNQYIDHLVQINSLEQLISINQNITSAVGTTSGSGTGSSGAGSSGTGSSTGAATGVTGSAFNVGPGVAKHSTVQPTTASVAAAPSALGKHGHVVHGNMSVPPVSASAQTVAGSLAAQHTPAGYGHAIRDIPLPRFMAGSQ